MRHVLYKQTYADKEQNKDTRPCKTLGDDLILRLTCKRGCDHGDGDPRGEAWRRARDAVRAGGKPRSETACGSESEKT